MARNVNLQILAVMERADLARVSEREFQRAIWEYAAQAGWLAHYMYKSAQKLQDGTYRGLGTAGWPDIFACRGERAIAIEVKSMSGRPTPEQRRWLAALKEAGIETALWKPDDAKLAMEVLS